MVEVISLGAAGISLLSTVGKNVLVKTLTTSTSSIISAIETITLLKHQYLIEIINKLDELDIKHKIELIELFVEEQNEEEIKKLSIKKALEDLNDILKKIDEEFNTIIKAIENHREKYLRNWRSFNCKYNIKTIEKDFKILNSRYEDLKDLIKVYNKPTIKIYDKIQKIDVDNFNKLNIDENKLIVEDDIVMEEIC